MTCPACGIGLDEDAVEALILNHLTDIDSHDHDIVLDGSDVYTITQNYADARPATQFIVPGLSAAADIAVAAAVPQSVRYQATFSTALPKDGTWYPVGAAQNIALPAGWGSMKLWTVTMLRFASAATAGTYRLYGRMTLDAGTPTTVPSPTPQGSDDAVAVVFAPSTVYSGTVVAQAALNNSASSADAATAIAIEMQILKLRQS